MAHIRSTTPLRVAVSLSMQDSAPDPDFDGLTRYESSVDFSTGFGPFSISLDPSADYGDAVPTGDRLVLRFVMGEVGATYVSSAGECTVTFTTVSAEVLGGEFTCHGVPSQENEITAEVTGTFNFEP